MRMKSSWIISKFCAPLFSYHIWISLKSFCSCFLKIAFGLFIVASLITYFALITFIGENTNPSDVTTPDWHTMRDMVVCIDKISSDNDSSSDERKPVHFVFIGDSRIRQHFLNFFKFIPNFDLEYQPKYNSYYKVSEDMNITSRLLNFRISFYFRRFLGDDTNQVFLKWTGENVQTEGEIRFILVGISLHHMLDANGSVNFDEFKEKLTQLKPIVNRVAKRNNVVWLNQYPVIDSFGPRNTHNDVFSEKVHRYNMETKRILELIRNSGVFLWESGNDLVEEYLRSCVLQQRADLKYFGNAYFNCLDYAHPGYSALSQAIQFFFTDMCSL